MKSLCAPLIAIAFSLTPLQMSGGMSTLSRPYSAGVAITTFAQGTRGGPLTLALMVLWRGEPGWYTKDGPRGGSGGGTSSTTYTIFRSGGLTLRVDVAGNPRTVQIQSKTVALDPPDANVILVDRVDKADGTTIVKTLSIDPSMPDGELRLETVLRRSKDIVTFLRCDQEIQHPLVSGLVTHNCGLLLGKY